MSLWSGSVCGEDDEGEHSCGPDPVIENPGAAPVPVSDCSIDDTDVEVDSVGATAPPNTGLATGEATQGSVLPIAGGTCDNAA